jgi:hypothetical protein
MVLLLVELLFPIPISNAKVERLFSLMNHVKTDYGAALSKNTLDNLIRIRMEGPSFEQFDHTAAIDLWATTTTHRQNQRERKEHKKGNRQKSERY